MKKMVIHEQLADEVMLTESVASSSFKNSKASLNNEITKNPSTGGQNKRFEQMRMRKMRFL